MLIKKCSEKKKRIKLIKFGVLQSFDLSDWTCFFLLSVSVFFLCQKSADSHSALKKSVRFFFLTDVNLEPDQKIPYFACVIMQTKKKTTRDTDYIQKKTFFWFDFNMSTRKIYTNKNVK